MNIKKTFFEEVFHFELEAKNDCRGSFSRFFCKKFLKKLGVNFNVKQISFAKNTKRHTLRGLHFQKFPSEEQKIICCTRGAIWDVIVDIRVNSKNYGKWFSIELNHKKQNCLFVPRGFAHGYITLTHNTEIIYLMDKYYNSKESCGLIWNDPSLKIKWPYTPLKISKKDENLPRFDDLL